jgi:2-oxo-4-hydroxy-4-carboxy-5-ureidoimidazoline decarboxylase
MTHDAFLARYGGVYEASPWVARAVWPAVERGDVVGTKALADAMRAAVDSAEPALQLALIRAHPELAGRAAIAGEIADASKQEQVGAGLDQCTPREFARFHALNDAYNARFAFPFIIAVKGLDRAAILAQFEARLGADPQAEFATALAQIHRIAGFRLAALEAEGTGP